MNIERTSSRGNAGWSERLLYALNDSIRKPALAIYYIRHVWDRMIIEPRHKNRIDEIRKYRKSFVGGIASLLNISTDVVRDVMDESDLKIFENELKLHAASNGLDWNSWAGHTHLCYVICRLTKPDVVLETGVGIGWTSAYILRALEVNKKGELHSIELPPLGKERSNVGVAVPEHLRRGWNLHLGAQKELLPNVVQSLGTIDFAHYDSDKLYTGMKIAYRQIWRHLRLGGILISDDVFNDAFIEFAESVEKSPIMLDKGNDIASVGMIRQQSDSDFPSTV